MMSRMFICWMCVWPDRTAGQFSGMTFAPRFGPGWQWVDHGLGAGTRWQMDIFEMDLRTQGITQLTRSACLLIHRHPIRRTGSGLSLILTAAARSSFTSCAVTAQSSTDRFGEGRYATPVWSPRGDIIAFTKIYRGEFLHRRDEC